MWLTGTVIEVRDSHPVVMPDHRVHGNMSPEGVIPIYGLMVLPTRWRFYSKHLEEGVPPLLSWDTGVRAEQLAINTTQELIDGVTYMIDRFKLPRYKWVSPTYKSYNTQKQRDRMTRWLADPIVHSNVLSSDEYNLWCKTVEDMVEKGILLATPAA
jgi:hypothetical protein